MKNDPSSNQVVRMARRASFSSAHYYANAQFSEIENKDTFGKCYTTYGHGHNYVVEAYFEGKISADTGLIINLLDIDTLLKEVVQKLDHQHLNFDTEDFKNLVPTTEVIARYIYKKISAELAKRFANVEMSLYKVRLFETEDLWVEYGEA